MQAEFKINVKAYWNKSGKFETLQNNEDNNTDEIEIDNEEDEDEEDENGIKL